ncbi:hypothetical protein [Sphingomonas yabuuchiae]|nr:hypothetical protein [Sphingomonas yabuuchiae]
MSDTDTPKKSAKVLRDFKDAGTLRSFTQGTTVDITEGEYANYAAAGLVGEPDAAEAAPTDNGIPVAQN